MKQEYKCPKCVWGSLREMTDRELKKAGWWDFVLRYNEKVYGCDECQNIMTETELEEDGEEVEDED